MVDLTDFPCSIWPGLMDIIGPLKPLFVVGNKIDLIPPDSKHFLTHIHHTLIQHLEEAGIKKGNIKHVSLISAKTGFGVERLINKLHSIWQYKGEIGYALKTFEICNNNENR